MATFRITAPDGGVYEITAPDDATQEQVLAYARANLQQSQGTAAAPAPSAPAQTESGGIGQVLAGLPRQIGLTARHGIEGLAQAAEIGTEPIRNLIVNPAARLLGLPQALPASQAVGYLGDRVGLPQPRNATERMAGDAARLMAGAGGLAGGANAVARGITSATGLLNTGALAPGGAGLGASMAESLAANPAAQIGGAAGSGLASGAAREGGASELTQAGAGILGSIGGGLLGNAAMRGVSRIAEPIATAAGADPLPATLSARRMDDTQLSSVLRNRLRITGGDWDAIPRRVQQSILADVRRANDLENLDPAALGRLADFRALGMTPTRGTVTLDPIQITQEKNLAKAGANSRLGSAQGLARIESENNQRMIQTLQQLEGGVETDPIQAGRTLSSAIANRRDALRSAEQAAWDAAKSSPGYRVPIQAKVISDINAALDDQGLMPFMDSRISAYMRAFQDNPERFTPQAYRNLQSMLAQAMRAGGNEAAAAGVARRVLEEANFKPAATQFPNPQGLPVTQDMARLFRATDSLPEDAMRAIDAARDATRQAYQFESASPLVRSALSEGASSDPARLAQRFIINGTPDEAAEAVSRLGPDGLRTARNAIATHIKRKALNGAADEVGSVSQKALNSAIRSIGDEKLGMFFTPEEIQQLGRLGRVSSYTQIQPSGSAVNNSNSGALLVGKGIDLLSSITSKIPLLNIDQQVGALVNLGRTSSALRADRVIYAAPERFGLLSNAGRGLAAGGLLALPQYANGAEDR